VKPARNLAYLKFIRRQPCAICSRTSYHAVGAETVAVEIRKAVGVDVIVVVTLPTHLSRTP